MIAHGGDDVRPFIVGAGRAGRGLARAFFAAGVPVAGLHGRRAEPATADSPAISAGALPPGLGGAGAVIVAVRDAQLDAALRELLAAAMAPGTVVLHASGASEPVALEELRRAGFAAGTFHPLVPLADAARAAALLRGAWIGVDGDAAAQAMSQRLAERIGAHTLVIPPGEKARYHAAAVFASNFPIVLAALASGLLHDAGVDERSAWAAVRSLLSAAVANLEGREPADALTGPIARGDAGTVARHLEALSGDPARRELYRALSRAALALAREGKTAPPALDAVARLLDDA